MSFVQRRPNARSGHTVEGPTVLGKWMLGKWKIIFIVVITLLLVFARNTEPPLMVQFSWIGRCTCRSNRFGDFTAHRAHRSRTAHGWI